MTSTKFVEFTTADVTLAQAFLDAMGIKLSLPAQLDTNNELNDTLEFGDFTIIKDNEGKLHVDAIMPAYSWEHGPEQLERSVGEYFSLPLALGGIAECVCRDNVQVFFENSSYNPLV